MSSSSRPFILVLGAGPAGLGAASELQRLGCPFQVLEAQDRPIGRCKSHRLGDVFFDEGPHISFTKSQEIRELFARNVQGRFHTLEPRLMNHWQGRVIPHPVQSHLAFVPEPLRSKILNEIRLAYAVSDPTWSNFEDWLVAHFGRTFFAEFPARYTRKYWTTEAANLNTEWVSNRISRPALSIIEAGAASLEGGGDEHYFTEFRYPDSGGYESFLKTSADQVTRETRLSARVTAIHPAKRWVEINGAERVHYEHLISSIPLDLIPQLLIDAPPELAGAAARLSCSSATLYNVIYRAKSPIHHHWGYVYDEDIPFARYYFPKMLVQAAADPIQAVQAEVYSSRHRPRDLRTDSIENVLRGFERIGLFSPSDVVDLQVQEIRHANVIFDHERSGARNALVKYLEDHDIKGVGRYGSWRYLWSDESFLDGRAAVRNILKTEGST